MKWVFLAVSLALIAPLSAWLRSNPQQTWKLWVVVGFLPFGMGTFHLYVGPISWGSWPGFVKGMEISLLDVLALSIYLSLPRGGQHVLPFRLSMLLYLLAVTLSATQTDLPMASLFYVWQLARMFLVYAVVARGCDDERTPSALLTGMVIGLGFQAVIAGWGRFVGGAIQVGGTFGHQNLLGMMAHFVVFPTFASLLAGRPGWTPLIGPLSGAVTAILTVSRATIGLAGLGYAAVFAISIFRGWSSRKASVALAAAILIALLVPVILASFDRRFAAAPLSEDYDERAAFERAAAMIVADYPMGIGANTYVVVANSQGYLDRAGVVWTRGSRSTHVHNVYWLVAAETGFLGLIGFLLLLLRPLIVAARCALSAQKDPRRDLLLGLGIALLIVYIHCLYEWVFLTFTVQYMFAITVGLIVGLARQLGYWKQVGTVRLTNETPATLPNSPKPVYFLTPKH